MRTAVLAVLVAADMGMTPKVIAANYHLDQQAVQSRLDHLEAQGAVYEENGIYYAEQEVRDKIVSQTRSAARQD